MAFKEINPKLQLNFNEYIETWNTVLSEYHGRGLSEKITEKLFGMDNDRLILYSLELGTVLLVIAMRHWNSSKRFNDDSKKKVADAVAESFYLGLPGDDIKELLDEYLQFYRTKYNIFYELCPNLGERNAKTKQIQMELVGLARYLVAQVSDRVETDNQQLIEEVGAVLIKAAAAFSMLAKNSSPNPQMIGKLKFIVQK